MYNWRKMTPEMKAQALESRRLRKLPWHSPPHLDLGYCEYLITAACYEHMPVLGKNTDRMAECEAAILAVCQQFSSETFAWCVLPNHYHVLLRTDHIKALCRDLGKFHGRSSFAWNGEDGKKGRRVWFNCFERSMRSDRHFWATLNYVHHNPVHHGYVTHWQDWPYSSAAEFLAQVGREKASEIWHAYPIMDYGKKWDL